MWQYLHILSHICYYKLKFIIQHVRHNYKCKMNVLHKNIRLDKKYYFLWRFIVNKTCTIPIKLYNRLLVILVECSTYLDSKIEICWINTRPTIINPIRSIMTGIPVMDLCNLWTIMITHTWTAISVINHSQRRHNSDHISQTLPSR